MDHPAQFWTEKKLSSSSSRPNDVGAGDGGGADGGNTGASIGGSTTGVASPARRSPTATAGVWPISSGGQYTSRTCTGGLSPFFWLRGRGDLCARYFGTHVHSRACLAKQLHCPRNSSISISDSPLLAIAMHGAAVEPIMVCSSYLDILLVVINILLH